LREKNQLFNQDYCEHCLKITFCISQGSAVAIYRWGGYYYYYCYYYYCTAL